MFSKSSRTAQLAAERDEARLVAEASRAAQLANLEMRRRAARRDAQARFDSEGLPRGFYLER